MNSTNDSARVSTFRLVAGTPMRDLVRGRITGRLDIDYLTEAAGLPDPIRDVVKRTVRRTRLLSIEKSDVARELISHFREGLDSGADASSLASTFGDVRVAARLIRRAKKRDRSFPLKATFLTLKSIGVFLVVLILTYGVLAIRYFGAKPGPTVDYLTRLNAAALAIPEDERAWPVYRAALIEHQPRQYQTKNKIYLFTYPGWRDWDRAADYVRSQAPFLDEVRRGASMRGMGYIASAHFTSDDQLLWPENAEAYESSGLLSGSLVQVLLPHLGEMNSIAHMLVIDIRLAASEGDGERTAANLLAMIGIANQIREIPLLINDLFAISIAARASDELMRVLHEHPDLFSDEQLKTLAHTLAAFPSDGQPLARFDGERMIFEDTVQRLYSLDNDGNGVLVSGAFDELMSLEGRAQDSSGVANALVGPVAAAVIADRKSTLGFYNDAIDGLLSWSNQSPWRRGEHTNPVEALDTPLARTRHGLATLIMPAFENTVWQAEQTEFVRDAALVVIAITLFERREGRLPSTLDELVSDLLPRIPVDPFSGEPLGYRAEGDSFVLWSIGNDYIDDGGELTEDTRSQSFRRLAGRWFAREVVEDRIGRVKAGDPQMVNSTKKGERAPGIVDGDWILYPPAPVIEPPPKEEYPEVLRPE